MNKRPGFTITEMAIVLVIIGLILAAVMKGGDIFHSAQIDRVNKGFFEAWKTVVYEYYDRRGQYLGDGVDNGGTIDPSHATYLPGRFDGFLGQGQSEEIISVAQNAGIDICSMIQSDIQNLTGDPDCGGKNIFERNVSGGFTGKGPVEVGFYTCLDNSVIRNCLLFTGVPNDVAMRLDTYYDGTVNGETGSIRIADEASLDLTNPLIDDYVDFDITASSARSDIHNLVMILQF